MYEQIEKQKEIISRPGVNTMAQKKSNGKKCFGDNHLEKSNGIVQRVMTYKNIHTKDGIRKDNRIPQSAKNVTQRLVKDFKSTNLEQLNPLEQVLKYDINGYFKLNEEGDDVKSALKKRLPSAPKRITVVSQVEANVKGCDESAYNREGHKSRNVGHVGRQESLLTIGEEAYYQGGHLIPHGLLCKKTNGNQAHLVDGYTNLVPMEAALNNLTYKTLENKIGDGEEAKVTINCETQAATTTYNIISKVTGCPLENDVNDEALDLTPTIARKVTVKKGPDDVGEAVGLQRLGGQPGLIEDGATLLEWLTSIGAAPSLSGDLKKQLGNLPKL